jgi:hypothetical protein
MPLNASQLCARACAAVKAPGYTVQAQEFLNIILADLADSQDLDLCRGSFTINLVSGSGGSGPYNLPMDYKRAERNGVRYYIQGVPYNLISIDLVEFQNQVQQPGIATYPVYFATDISPLGLEPPSNPLLYVWPPSSLVIPLLVEYRRVLPDLVFTGTTGGLEIPWFPNQEYLLTKLKAMLADEADDTRAAGWHRQALEKLDAFMKLTNDDEGRTKTVTKDRRRFGNNYAQLPNTKSIGWLFAIFCCRLVLELFKSSA